MCCLFSRPSVLAEIFPFSYILFSQLQFSIFLTPSFYTTQPMPHNRIFTSIHPCMDLFLCSPNTYLKLLKVKTMSYSCPDSASDSAKVPKWWSENIWLIHSFILFFPLPIFFHWEWKLHRDLPHPFSLFSLSPPFQLTSLLFWCDDIYRCTIKAIRLYRICTIYFLILGIWGKLWRWRNDDLWHVLTRRRKLIKHIKIRLVLNRQMITPPQILMVCRVYWFQLLFN